MVSSLSVEDADCVGGGEDGEKSQGTGRRSWAWWTPAPRTRLYRKIQWSRTTPTLCEKCEAASLEVVYTWGILSLMRQLLPFVSQWWQCAMGGPSVLKGGTFLDEGCVQSNSSTGVSTLLLKGSLVWDFDGASGLRGRLSGFTINTSRRWVSCWLCVGTDTFFFPDGAEPHPLVAFSLSTADCTALNKLLLCWKKLWHQLAAHENSWSDYWSAWETVKNERRRDCVKTLHSMLSLGTTCHINRLPND